MERQSELVVDSLNQVTIPTDYLELIHMIHEGDADRVKLQRLEAGDLFARTQTGATLYFTRLGGVWEFRGSAIGDTVTVYYYGDPPPIEEDTDSDPLFLIAADLVNYGALSYAADQFQDERGPTFEARFQQLLEEVEMHAMNMEAREGYRAVSPGTDLEY
jgi:hypothetical protein